MGYTHFTKTERNEISILLNKGYSIRDIALALGRSPSSISREIKKNSVKGQYVADKADLKAYVRRKYSKFQWQKIRQLDDLEEYIQARLKDKWTPEQIAGRLKLENGNQALVSCKTIYNYLNTQFGQPYQKYLPRHKKRRKKGHKLARQEWFKTRVFIDKRPVSINDRKFIGHWEGDTLGYPKSAKQTLVGLADRKSRYFTAKKIPALKETIDGFKELGRDINLKSLTLDNGPENARHTELATKVYFCHPYSAWEKPTIENTFQRFRRFVPKKSKFEDYTDQQIQNFVNLMNYTPRKCLNYLTPHEVHFNQKLQLTSVALEG